MLSQAVITFPNLKVKNENEAVYDEVKVDKEPAQAKSVEDATYAEVQRQNERVQQTSDKTGLLSDKAAERCRRYQLLASCFGTLCHFGAEHHWSLCLSCNSS
ncbi:hypothetical protein ATANTOWER_023883 [Ataeniobius toweri]|uniref:Uncharacterized protein n=1 Tax=Ataeniobius toweri TaxID=208326 RepID=A0ABU7BKA9_9TELE|nr:hypothetical protein [Ataeniobius toweri]